MLWMNILKYQPASKFALIALLYDERAVNKLIQHLSEVKPTASFRGLIDNYKAGNISVQSMMNDLPNPEVTEAEVQERMDRIVASVRGESARDFEPIIDEANALGFKMADPNYEPNDADERKFRELEEQITELSDKDPSVFRRNKRIGRKLRTFRGFLKNWTLNFKKIPSEASEKQEFDEKIEEFSQFVIKTVESEGKSEEIRLGRVLDNRIITNFDSAQSFTATVSMKKEIMDYYSENIAQYEPNVTKDLSSMQLGGADAGIDELSAKGVKYEVTAEEFDYTNVQSYLNAVTQISGNIAPFIPDKMENQKLLPAIFFLTRESVRASKSSGQKSLVLNPYANLLLASRFVGEESWFNDMFSSFRQTQMTSEKLSELLLLDDIYNSLKNNDGVSVDGVMSSKKYKVPLAPYSELTLGENVESGRESIKRIRDGNRDYANQFLDVRDALTRNRLTELTTNFSIREVREIQEIWEEEGLDIEYDLEVVYLDNTNDEVPEERFASFARIEIDGKAYTPKDLMAFLEENEVAGELSDKATDKLRNTIVETSKFANFLVSLSSERLKQLVREPSSDARFMDKIDAENSLAFLSKMSERMVGENRRLVTDAMLAIADEEDMQKKFDIAQELNGKMEGFLQEVQEQIRSAFREKLKDFAENYDKKSWGKKKGRVMDAIRNFERVGLLRVVG